MINRDNDKGKTLISRTIFIMIMNLIILLVMILRLYYLQIYQADKYKYLAEKNRISNRILVPRRGLIFDRNNKPIAINQQNFTANIISEQARNVDETLHNFNEIVSLSEENITKIKKDIKKNKKFVPIKVRDNLTWKDVSKIQLQSDKIPGIIIDEGLNRHYPYSVENAHLVGYIGFAPESYKKKNPDPLLDIPEFKVGLKGLEDLYENNLRGKAGNLKLEVNAFGRIMQEIEKTNDVQGQDIVLSIDVRLQQKAVELFGETSGAVIIMNVHTGEIITFASFPTFDSNMIVKGISNEDWASLIKNPKKPLTNKAIAGLYPPGSTFKPIVALAALENKIVKKDDTHFCSGKMELGNHTFHCWRRYGHGDLNLIEAIQHSCDVYFYKISLKLGIDKIYDMATMFGLGQSVNLGIKGERTGTIPNREWKLRNFGTTWQQGESVISGIGQGYILTSPMQLAIMTSQLVNGGYKITPKFIKTDILQKNQKLPVSEANLEIVKQGMHDVMNKERGSGYASRFNYKGKKMGGKTGTAQIRRISMQERKTGIIKQDDLPWHLRDHGLFVGYAPHDKPKYAIAVVAEHGGSGPAVATPIAAGLLLEALKLDDIGDK